MENNSPITIHQKVEYITHNHVDTNEILFRLKRIERRVEQDTTAETALAEQNAALRKQIEDLLSGDVLPEEVKGQLRAFIGGLKTGKEDLAQAVAENPLP